MPQMAPILWLQLLLTFISLNYIYYTIIFFMKKKIPPTKFIKLTMHNKNWKW